MNDYIIMEYDFEKRRYTTIGMAEGCDGKEAKMRYKEEHGWETREGIVLFAKPPVCR